MDNTAKTFKKKFNFILNPQKGKFGKGNCKKNLIIYGKPQERENLSRRILVKGKTTKGENLLKRKPAKEKNRKGENQ